MITKQVLRFISSVIATLYCTLSITQAQNTLAPQRNYSQELVGETIANRESSLYRFEQHDIDSIDGNRHYRIEISIPLKPAPKGGYPVLYMLDGNAAMATLTDQDLISISATTPPVLVAIGYDVQTRNDVISRAYDYTPPVYKNGQQIAEPVVRGRAGGGADIFLELITSQIKPLVQARANVNARHEYLWGHSYGGLFALHTLFTQSDAFSRYIVGDPSAWWYDGALLKEWHAFNAELAAGKRVAILVGTKPRESRNAMPPSTANQKDNGVTTDPRAAVKEIAGGLQQHGAQVSYEEFPQHGHGDMIRVSLKRALEIASS